jgi:hypothetical protein
MFKHSIPTSQETHSIYITKTNQLIQLGNTLCGQREEVLIVKADGTSSNHCVLESRSIYQV